MSRTLSTMAPENNSGSTIKMSKAKFSTALMRRMTARSIQRRSSLSSHNFKDWHRRMQADHQKNAESFHEWRWCERGCKLCIWFDRIDYSANLCKCCFKFKTLKSLGTLLLAFVFIYLLLYSIFRQGVLPGGIIFFLFTLFATAYMVGQLLSYVGFPSMMGYLVVGIIIGNLTFQWLPDQHNKALKLISIAVEKVAVVTGIIRAGLLLDLPRVKGYVSIIVKIAFFPLLSEILVVTLIAHFLLQIELIWSALMGSILSIVSLASITSIVEANRMNNYGENIYLSTVLIAASAIEVIIAIFAQTICLSIIFSNRWHITTDSVFGQIIINVIVEILVGLGSGALLGILVAYFPDKRHKEAPNLRIVLLGLGSFAFASLYYEFEMIGAALLTVLTMCLVASTMWQQMGWLDRNNPVQYFYTFAYYSIQPIALPLIGYSMNFSATNGLQVSLMISVIGTGLLAKVTTCYLVTLGKSYPTSPKEKAFISMAWLTKGTSQALLAYGTEVMAKTSDLETDRNKNIENADIIKQTSILAVLLSTPFVYYSLILLTPVLLTQTKERRRTLVIVSSEESV